MLLVATLLWLLRSFTETTLVLKCTYIYCCAGRPVCADVIMSQEAVRQVRLHSALVEVVSN